MKNFLSLLLIILSISLFAQNKVLHAGETDWPMGLEPQQESPIALKTSQIMSCAAGTIFTTGYPLWTNYYSGYMFKVNNISSCPVTINCFEARFQGTSGYQIHTKTGTFIGFETTPIAWTLVGSIAGGVPSISTITCSPIPIIVNITIPAGTSQSFYLTRNDNVVANRHLYVTGVGTAGTTVYASDVNVQITEAEYLDFPFGPLQIGVRRPSFDMYYNKVCPLPIELISFQVKKSGKTNLLEWITATETNNERFVLERSENAVDWIEIGTVSGSGTTYTKKSYSFNDDSFKGEINYYRLNQIDYDGSSKKSQIIVIENSKINTVIVKTTNIIGQEVNEDFSGLKLIHYSDGTVKKKID